MLKFGKKRVSLRTYLGLKREVLPKGFSSISDFLPEDVFIVGYPKSGNTWFQNLVSGVVHGVNTRWSPPGLVDDLVPDVHCAGIYRRYATPTFFKSHDLPQPDFRRVVYLLRDGRDVMVSFYHYLQAMEKKEIDFVEFVATDKHLFPCKWHEHVQAWDRNPYGSQVLTIKYEELLAQPVEQMERFCQFINLRRERSFLSAAVDAAKFSNLREKEARSEKQATEQFPAGKFFFRRGVAGSHKDEMPPAVLAAFLKDAAGTLQHHGYRTGAPAVACAAS